MSVDEILLDVEDRMDKAIDVLKHQLSGIRTGRANPGLVDSLRVEAYGTTSMMKQLATIAVPEPNQIVIRAFDPGTLKDMEKAIQASGLGFNPINDGKILRLIIPPLSTEVRKKMVSRIKELTEDSKVALRNVRRDGNKLAEQEEKDKTLTEDECESTKEQIQELTKQYENKASEMAKAKETEVMES